MTTTATPRFDLDAPRGTAPEPPRRSHRRLAVILGLVAAVVLAGAVVWLVEFSSAFATGRVAVVGAARVPVANIEAAAAVRMGTPLARQDLDGIAARVRSMPQIASVDVSRAWPDTVRIRVVERQPLLGVRQPDGFLIIDKSGVAFEVDGTLPDGVIQADIDPGNAPFLADAATVIQAMPDGLRHKVTRVGATSENAIKVTLTGGVTVNWGSADDSDLKAKVVEALLKRKPQAIDVSSPHNPAVR